MPLPLSRRKNSGLSKSGGFPWDSIAEDLLEKGWSVQENFLSNRLITALRRELLWYEKQDKLARAGVGRKEDFLKDGAVRGDKTRWLDRSTLPQCVLLDRMEDLRTALNRRLFLGLFEYEAHYAIYPTGAFYIKHLDSFKGEKNRIVSTVCYLNHSWQEEWGGLLNIYSPLENERQVAHVLPRAGTLAVFLSEDIPHEVTITDKKRMSIAGWFRCNASINGVIDPAN